MDEKEKKSLLWKRIGLGCLAAVTVIATIVAVKKHEPLSDNQIESIVKDAEKVTEILAR